MDIANATAAGPSRGLLDVIFGSEPGPEETEADGKSFGNLMNLIKVLNMKKEAEEKGTDGGRTLGETLVGKSIADSGAAGMPGMNAAVPDFAGDQLAQMQGALDQEQRDKLERWSQLGIPPALLMSQVQVPAQASLLAPAQPGGLEGVQPELVNRALQAKGLPPLSAQEMKLLQDVNGKLAQVNGQPGQKAELPPELLAAGAGANAAIDPKAQTLSKAAVPQGAQPIDPALQKAMASKGLDPRKLKVAEESGPSSSGTPEKMLSTEAYLQLHESANAGAANANAKVPGKDPAGKAPQVNGADSSAVARPEAALTAGAVAGAAQKGPGLGSRKGDDGQPLSEGTKQAKLDALGAGGFAAVAPQAEATKHDVYLPGADKPEQRTNALLAEVGTGVAFHAHKGGGEMRLVIHPDDLGEVKLKIGTKNGKVEVQVMAENEEVAKMIRGGSKELEASLKDQNLSLAKFEVSVSDASSVVSTDTKGGLSEQFLSQNQQHTSGGFSQGTLSDDSRGARWGSDQGGRQGGAFAPMAEDNGRATAKTAAFVPKMAARANHGSGRLDIVA